MKKFFFTMVAVMVATLCYAQNTLVATLSHGDNITMYYGVNALSEAHNAAQSGDVINLSGGAFKSVTITKALTIRGTGYNAPLRTTIVGDFYISLSKTVTDRLSFEGCHIANKVDVRGTLSNVLFLKNIIQSISCSDSDVNMRNAYFVNCRVYEMILRGNSTTQFINSEIANFDNMNENTASASFINCNIRVYNGRYGHYISSSQLVNCLIYNDVTSWSCTSLPSSSSAWNCVAIGPGSGTFFNDLAVSQNCQAAGFDIFQDEQAWHDLTDEAKAKYIGTDGTPIGYFGGMLPFDLTPNYPQITKMNVASKTTADGKLSVEIEVSAAE